MNRKYEATVYAGYAMEEDQTVDDITESFAEKFGHEPDEIEVQGRHVYIPRRLCPRCDAPTSRGGELCRECAA